MNGLAVRPYLYRGQDGLIGLNAEINRDRQNGVEPGHGTPAMYATHRREGTPPCDPCRRADSNRRTAAKRRRRMAGSCTLAA